MPAVRPEREEEQRRAFEVIAAVLGLVVLSPLMLLIAILIKLESPGPVFFVQKRVGKDGRLFEMIKFRSMRQAQPDEQTVPEVEDLTSFKFVPPNLAARRTRIGQILRESSLDELPNLLNVIRGEMHLVGPRPDEPELVAKYPADWQRRHSVKPGITGLAQVNGRNELTYQEIMAYDLSYADDHPFPRDVRIMLETISTVLRKKGAR